MRFAPQTVAVCLSLFVYPGAGQLYNRQWVKGLIVGLVFTGATIIWMFDFAKMVSSLYSITLDPENAQLPDMMPALMKMAPWFLGSLVLYTAAAIDSFVGGKKRVPASPAPSPEES